jgi:hypothetical protein
MIPESFRSVFQGGPRINPGAVDKDVEMAKLLNRGLHNPAAGNFLADVGADENSFSAGSPEQG